MKKIIHLFQIVFSKSEKGLWYDQDERKYDIKGWGIICKVWIGKMIRPVPKFWIKDSNPWQGDFPWFVIRCPWMIVPFISIAIRKFGIYFGFKTFEVKDKHRSNDRYGRWMRKEEFGTDEKPAGYLTSSMSIRRTRKV